MNVLQLCYKPPFPPVDGGTMAMNSVTQGLLAAGHTVKVLSICSDKHPVKRETNEQPYRQATGFEASFVDLSIHPLEAAVALLCGESYNVKRFYSTGFRDLIARTLSESQFDIIHLESIFLAPYLPTIRQCCSTPVVLRAHNVEHLIWRQMALNEKNALKRWYLKKLALALRGYELEHINDFDGIVCITANDADTFRREGCRKALTAIPFGIDIKVPNAASATSHTLYHIGSMDWQPNVDAVEWFLQEVWPLAKKEMPSLRLFLAGRHMPDSLLNLKSDGVTVEGEVPDAEAFIGSKQINIVPLRAGSGLRIKIVEAMALGKTVIATTTAASGIECADGENILIADTPQQFVDKLRLCHDSAGLCDSIGHNARKLAESTYSIASTTGQLLSFYNKIITKAL